MEMKGDAGELSGRCSRSRTQTGSCGPVIAANGHHETWAGIVNSAGRQWLRPFEAGKGWWGALFRFSCEPDPSLNQ